jgi:ABC-type lipoprotein release transport system permease subunit
MTLPTKAGRVAERSGPASGRHHGRFGPLKYIWRHLWGERGRNVITFMSLAVVSTVLALFLAVDDGLTMHFRNDVGVPTDENKELFEVKEVVGTWSSFMVFLCASLMALSTANAASMDVLERRFELSTLRALGTGLPNVILLLLTPLSLVVLVGLIFGPLLVRFYILLLGSDPRLPLGPDLGVPLHLGLGTLAFVLAVGSMAAVLGAVPSLASVLSRSPLEVLRDAP